MAALDYKKKELTGRHVLIMLLVFFGGIIAVNGYFLHAAITSFRGEDIKGSYRQGLEYNKTIEARAAQNQLGWTVRSNYIPRDRAKGRVIVQVLDAQNAPIDGLNITGKLRHPTDLAQDMDIEFIPEGAGRYAAQTNIFEGERSLLALARRGEETFQFKFDIYSP